MVVDSLPGWQLASSYATKLISDWDDPISSARWTHRVELV